MEEKIGDVLREQRLTIGLTQKQVAARAKVTERQYQTFEGGERSLMTCSFRTAGKVLNALELDSAAFFHGEIVQVDYRELQQESESAAEQLRRRREELGLTLKEVADRAEIILQQYQKYEGGQRDLRNGTFQVACRVIEALDMDIMAFFQGQIADKR